MKRTRTLLAITGVAILTASPFMTFAKDRGNDNDQGNKDNGHAWGHLIAPGWLKNFGDEISSLPSDLPPGIAEKLGIGTSTHDRGDNDNEGDHDDNDDQGSHAHHSPNPSPSPTTNPSPSPSPSASPAPFVLSNASAQVLGQNQALITWNTSNSANSTIWYSTSTPVATSTATSVTSSTNVFNHTVLLTGLSASTTYHYVIGSTDTINDTVTSAELTFTTSAGVVSNPLAISNAIATVGNTSVTLNWNTNLAADTEVYYSTSSPVVVGATSTTAVVNANLVTSHMMTINNLATSTTYYMILRSKDASNNMQTTSEFSFTTGL